MSILIQEPEYWTSTQNTLVSRQQVLQGHFLQNVIIKFYIELFYMTGYKLKM